MVGTGKTTAERCTECYYLFAKNHRLKFGYYRVMRDSTHQINETFQIGDQIYTANTTIRSESKSETYDIGYDYSVWHWV